MRAKKRRPSLRIMRPCERRRRRRARLGTVSTSRFTVAATEDHARRDAIFSHDAAAFSVNSAGLFSWRGERSLRCVAAEAAPAAAEALARRAGERKGLEGAVAGGEDSGVDTIVGLGCRRMQSKIARELPHVPKSSSC